jgi:WD40 repeat protein
MEKDLGYTLKIWDALRGTLVHDLSSQIERVGALAFNHDGTRLATTGFMGDQAVIHVWNTETGAPLLVFRGHKARIWSLAFSPDGRQIASVTSGTSKNAIAWNAETGEEYFALDIPRSFVPRIVAYSPNGQQLALASFDRIRIVSADTGAEILAFSGHTNQFWQVQFSPDGKRLVTTARGGLVSLWDVQGGQEVLSLTIGQNDTPAACFSPDGRRLAITCRGVARILDATPLPEKR